VQGLHDQFLAHAGLATHQHGQVARADQRDLAQQRAVGGAAAHQPARAFAAGRAAVLLGAALGILGTQGEVVHALGRGHGRGGQVGQALQRGHVDAVEARQRQCVQRHEAPGTVLHAQGAAHAIVHGQVAVHMLDQAVVGIGQAAVGREAQRARGLQQGLQPRVLPDQETPAQRVGRQAVHGQRHQRVAIQAQQRHGIGRQQAAHGVEQAPVTLGRRDLARQVGHQRQHGSEHGLGSHHVPKEVIWTGLWSVSF
jgi:hypothetical protein